MNLDQIADAIAHALDTVDDDIAYAVNEGTIIELGVRDPETGEITKELISVRRA